ncbi:MAG: multidrug ABC transporter ATP-binding protein [Acidobacteria bacterium RIFCSPLOWO2_12_FULL_54_10]|nr:MAG: multidrug ABC transporter ATP-binding protein [Acidobacteria bacterium RIFCSPLOWO2_12_FULL_54_10]
MTENPIQRVAPLFPYLRPYVRRYCLGFAVLLGEVTFWVSVPQIIRFGIDDLQAGVSQDKLLLYIGLLLVAALAKAFFLYWTRMILIGISRDTEYDLRNALYEHFTKLSLRYYQKNRTGDLMSRATNDLNAVRMLLGPGIMYSVRTLVLMAAAVTILFQISATLTLYCFVLVPIIAVLVSAFGRSIHHRFEKIQEMMSTISAKVQESMAGIRVIRAYAQEETDLRRFRELNDQYMESNRKLIGVWGMFYPLLEVLMGISYVIVLWAGGRAVINGEISIGSFVAFNVYMGQLAWPMIALGWVVNLYQRGTASLARLNTILQEQPDIRDEEEAIREIIPPSRPVISRSGNGNGMRADKPAGVSVGFHHLNFSYNERPTLTDIDFTIPAGKTLAIVGPTGSGKSTLVNLIPRLFNAPPGSITMDGVPLRHYRLQELRRMIGFVPQETFLFSDTIRGNIAFGVEQATDEQIKQAAEIASLLPDIEGFPLGFDTIVGERGITLSGGQKQRVAIARAVLRNPSLLILDDALSSVDTYTEEKILHRLREVLRGRTAILISHRISTIRDADEIIVLYEGHIAERGNHEELMARGSYYPELYQKQLLEEELERA